MKYGICIPAALILAACGGQNAQQTKTAEFSGSAVSAGIQSAVFKDYRIPYYEVANEPNQTAPTLQENDEPFAVIDCGPVGALPKEIKKPGIYAVFSHPAVPLAQLGAVLDETAGFFSIEPPLPGVYRWYGSRVLSFEPSAESLPQQRYTITVSENLKSLGGKPLTGNRSFSFETERLSVLSWQIGREGWINPSSVHPEDARYITVLFSYPVDLQEIAKYIIVRGGGKIRDFSLSRPAQPDISRGVSPDQYVQITLAEPPPVDTDITAEVQIGAKSQPGWLGSLKDARYSFHTLRPFQFRDFSVRTYASPQTLEGDSIPIALDFNYQVEKEGAESYFSIAGFPPLKPNNVKVYGDRVILNELPLEYEHSYTVRISRDLKDILGRTLSSADSADFSDQYIEKKIAVGSANSYVYIRDWGPRMLEAGYPQYLWETQNPARVSRGIAAAENPYARSFEPGIPQEQAVPRNKKYYFMEDLAPYLGPSGKGAVALNWEYETFSYWNRGGVNRDSAWLTLQVTDIGITVRYGYNKTLVWATRISTGQAISGADVELLEGTRLVRAGKTNGQGLAVFAFMDGDFAGQFTQPDSAKGTGFRIRVRENGGPNAGGDQAEFIPNDSHNLWRFDVTASVTPFTAEQEQSATFLFTDRGLYRPGETVTFRGIDRNLSRGAYQPYEGPYAISISGALQADIIANIQGISTKTGGFYGSFTLPAGLDPGDYTILYKRGTHQKLTAFKVANFQRLRFSADLKIPDTLFFQGEKLSARFSASYLAGGALSGAPCGWYWTREPAYFNPGGFWEHWQFGPSVSNVRSYIARGEGVLGPDGGTVIFQETPADGAEGAAYRYRLEASVQDAERQEITAQASATVHPGSFYLAARVDQDAPKPESPSAYFLSAGKPATLSWALVAPEGSGYQVPADWAEKITVQLIRHTWKQTRQAGVGGKINLLWQKTEEIADEFFLNSASSSSSSKNSSFLNFSSKNSSQNEQLLKTFNNRNAGTLNFTPKESGQWEIRLKTKDEKNRAAATSLRFYATGNGWVHWGGEDPDAISLTPDKDRYVPGETAKIMVRSPLPKGTYLLTLEREGIIAEKIIDLDGSAQTIDVPIESSFVPIVYVSVAGYTVRSGPPDHAYYAPDLDKPKGLFGVVPLKIDPESRRYRIGIEPSKGAYRPGETAEVALTVTLEGKPVPGAEVSFMAVDRGVIDLINYHVPDPAEYFYDPDRFPLGVRGADSRSLLIDPVTYTLSDLQGGDAEDSSKLEERKDFRPTAVFEPYLKTGPDGKVSVKFDLPDSLTAYRCTAVAVGVSEFGLAEQDLRVSAPLTGTAALPRKLRWRDTGTVSLMLTNLEKEPVDAEVSLTAENAAPDPLWDTVLAVDGPSEKTLRILPGATAAVQFRVAAVGSGESRLIFTLRSPHVNERIVKTLAVDRPVVTETVTTIGSIGGSDAFAEEGVILPAMVPEGSGSLSVTLAASRLARLKDTVQYLLNYPYGCLEQRTAALLPIIAFGDYLKTFGLDSPVENPRQTAAAELHLLSRQQRSDGSFPYWFGGSQGNVFVCLRMAHIAALAAEKGYDTSRFSARNLLRYINSFEAGDQIRRDPFLAGYALWVRTMHGEQAGAEIADLLRSEPDLGVAGWSFAGLAALELGRPELARSAQNQIKRYIRPAARTLDLSDSYAQGNGFWGGDTDRYALALMLFHALSPDDDMTTRLADALLERQRRGIWTNTAESFWAVLALGRVADAEDAALANVSSASVSLGGQPFLKDSFSLFISETKNFSQSPLMELPRDALLPLKIERTAGGGRLHYAASLRYGIPAELAAPRDEGLGVYVETFGDDGRRIADGRYLPGKTYTRRAIVSSSRDRTFVALRVPVPSGAEIIDAGFATSGSDFFLKKENFSEDFLKSENFSEKNETVQFILDDEVRFHWERFPPGRQEVSFRFRAVMPGVYPTPPAQAECMYEEEVFGRSPGELAFIPEA